MDGSTSSNISSVSICNIERGNNMLQKIPSRPTDFRSNHPGIIQVHMTSTKKDLTGTYHVRGEITKNCNTTLNSVMVIVHFDGVNGQLVADSLCRYINPRNMDRSYTSTFDNFAMANEISGEPISYRLSFDLS